MSDAMIRQWAMLRMIPRAPQKIDTRRIHEALKAEHDITQRQVQRDLRNLSRVFPLVCDEHPQHYGWSWSKQGAVFDLPCLDAQTSLTLKLASLFLPRVLPRATVRETARFACTAPKRLSMPRNSSAGARWADFIGLKVEGGKLKAPRLKNPGDPFFQLSSFNFQRVRHAPRGLCTPIPSVCR